MMKGIEVKEGTVSKFDHGFVTDSMNGVTMYRKIVEK